MRTRSSWTTFGLYGCPGGAAAGHAGAMLRAATARSGSKKLAYRFNFNAPHAPRDQRSCKKSVLNLLRGADDLSTAGARRRITHDSARPVPPGFPGVLARAKSLNLRLIKASITRNSAAR